MITRPYFHFLLSTLQFEFVDADTSGLKPSIIPERTWPCLLIARHTACRTGIFWGEKRVAFVEDGEVFLIPPEQCHHLQMTAVPGTMAHTEWLHVNFMVMESINFFTLVELPARVPEEERAPLKRALHRAISLHRGAPTITDLAAWHALSAELFAILLRLSSVNDRVLLRLSAYARLLPALRHIRARLDQPLPAKELAQSVGMSFSRFSELFSETIGMSLSTFIREQRLRKARMLLLSGHSVQEVAQITGWGSPFSFSRAFKAATSMSPENYKRNTSTIR